MIDVHAIKAELDATEHNARTTLICKYALLYGVSAATIRRRIRDTFGPAKKVVKKKKIDDSLIDEIGKLKIQSANLGLGERELSTENCIELLQQKGIKGAELLTVSTVNRRLEEKGFRKRDPIVRVEAAYANQMHQMDFSRSKYFQLEKFDREAGDYVLKVSGKSLFYKDPDETTRKRTWLVGITDAYSRVSLSRAFAASGESIAIGVEMLNFVYNRPEDEHPLRSLSEKLKTDNGAFIKHGSVKAMLKALEIESELSIPEKKHGIQKQESQWKTLWQRFELKLAMKMGDGKRLYLSEYNDLLFEFALEQLEQPHPVRRGTRGHLYRSSLTAHPERIIQANFKEVAFKVVERKVKQDLTISVNNQKFEAPLYAIDKRIRVYSNLAGEMVGELIDEYRKPFTLKPTEGFVLVGDYEHRPHATYKQKLETEVKREQKEEKERAKEAKAKKINYIAPRQKKVEPKTKFTEAVIDDNHVFPSIYKAKVYIGSCLAPVQTYDDVAVIFDDLLAEDLSKMSIDQVINAIKNQQQVM